MIVKKYYDLYVPVGQVTFVTNIKIGMGFGLS